MNALALSWSLPYFFSLRVYMLYAFLDFLNKGRSGGWVAFFKKRMKMDRGKGVRPISVFILKKIALFFKQQIEFFLKSCLAVAKTFLYEKGVYIFSNLFWKYICVKNTVIFYVEFKKKNYFFSFHSPFFISILEMFLRGGGVTHQSEHMLREEGVYM